jgi:hypothetical protein
MFVWLTRGKSGEPEMPSRRRLSDRRVREQLSTKYSARS